MKKTIKFIVAVALVAVLLSGCAVSAMNEKKQIRGTIEDNVYTSEFSGLTFTASEDWKYYTDEEITELTGISPDDEMSNKVVELRALYDMVAVNMTTGSHVMVMYENLAIYLGGMTMSEDEFMESVSELLEKSDPGIYLPGESFEGTLGEQAMQVYPFDVADTPMKQYYYIKKLGKYILAVIITTTGEDVSEITANFS